MILAATGHRPDKVGGYGWIAQQRLDKLAAAYVNSLYPDEIISGFALGWDQSVARAAIALGVPLVAAIPFYAQASAWPAESRAEWIRLIGLATRVVIVCPGDYLPSKMQSRNEWMVDRCDTLLALWNGTPGGTAKTVRYAQQSPEIEIINAWPGFETCK